MDKTVSGVLFDLDGTLLDTANDLGEALNFVLQQHQLPIVSRESYRPVASDGALGLLKLGFGELLDNYDVNRLRKEFLDYYQQHIALHTCLYPGINTLIKTLDEQSIPWGIVTNKPEYLTHQLLPHFSELDNAKVIVGGDTLPQRKPDPMPILFACDKMQITPKKSIYVGDAPRDIDAGNSAGLYSVIALWGYIKNTTECRSWQADIMCETPEQILKITL